ncbi:MAG: glycosyltransferase family 9 protein [Pirellulales bacterium]
MKKAVVTIASGDFFQRMAALTHPTIQAYADKIGADFIVWSDVTGYTIPEYKKMEIGQLLDVYDRALYIDTDVIIRDEAPDVFAAVPEDRLGMLEEGEFFDRRDSMRRLMHLAGRDFAAWDGKYYNAGVFVCSRCHRDLFVRPPVEYDNFGDQSWFNTMICDRRPNMFPLPHRFNRLASLDAVYGEDRLDAWFLHYAGLQSLLGRERLLELIAEDIATWRRMGPHHPFRRNIAIVVEGGLGSHVAAEPVVRHAREVLYPGDNLVAVSAWPEVFGHLNLRVCERIEAIKGYRHYRLRHTRNDPFARSFLARHQIHPTTLASLVALGSELPLQERTPRLVVNQGAVDSVTGMVRPDDVGRLVLVHPGRGTPPKTFPADVWQSYANTLVDHGYRVAVIGKRIDDKKGVVEFDRSKCIDLVDRLSVLELIALVSQARVLVSNDSGPVQIAGAFDRWIGLIATLRHPQFVLPWRNGSPFWRAASLTRGEMYADYFHRPSGGSQPPLGVCGDERLRECLPEPPAILEFVNSAFADA